MTPLADFSEDNLSEALANGLETEEGIQAHESGKGIKALSQVNKRYNARYKAPYLAHATMEPMNCTVKISANDG